MEAMVYRKDLLDYLQSTLKPELFQDYGPNGLQVEGAEVVRKIIVGVTANKALIQKAIESKADTLLVHHGIFWKNTPAPIIGVQYQRIKALMDYNINLIAYHLPLDAHQTLGNHVQLAEKLGIKIEQFLDLENQPGLVVKGSIGQHTPQVFVRNVENVLQRKPLYISGVNPNITQIA
ncbi:MAG TPA: Nif3-like dinuclear metal center hexameric protein, partial [Gammaproteobacteria bacterium]|nr:Nif3-like dinuclear metal center hexameric protein [Gammaproteobacteria bacterium]